MSKLLTVFGATGNQGGSVISTVLAHPTLSKEYKLRAVTRDASKPAAQALASKGVQVVAADLDDRDAVFKAVQGSTHVFAMTDFWAKLSFDSEVAQGKTIADAAKAAGVEHLIWSSLVFVSKRSEGRMTAVKHFDSKATVEEYIRELGINATFYMPGGFMQSFTGFFREGEDGSLSANVPFDVKTARVPLIDAAGDTGVFVAAILLSGPEVYGKRITAAYKNYNFGEVAEIMSKVTGKKATVNVIPAEMFQGFLPPAIAHELTANMMLLNNDLGYYIGEPEDSVEQAVALVKKTGAGKLTSVEEYLTKEEAKKA